MSHRKQLNTLIGSLKKGEKLQESQIINICELGKEILSKHQSLVSISSPVTICGDIHGQFEDLLELFKVGGSPPYTNYIFLGDYVDRGKSSIQTFILLLAFKIRYKGRVTLLRGNHQSRLITQVYGFYDECIKKYGSLNVWKACTQVFDYLPLAAVVDNKILCVHGGLSPSVKTLRQIEQINNVKQIPHEGPMCDILWSDPDHIEGWALNTGRGAGYLFGKDVVNKFCHQNSLELISRAHQLVMEGYMFMFDEKLVTVWSAPNYRYRLGNIASIMEIDENLNKYFKIFEMAPIDINENVEFSVPHYFL